MGVRAFVESDLFLYFVLLNHLSHISCYINSNLCERMINLHV